MEIKNPTSLRNKFIYIFVIMLTIISILNLYINNSVGDMISNVNQTYESNIQISQFQNSLNSMQKNLYNYLNGNYDSLKVYYSEKNNVQRMLDSLNNKPSSSKTKLIEKNIRGLTEEYLKKAEDAVFGHRGTDIEQYSANYEEATILFGYLESNINTLNSLTFNDNTLKFERITEAQKYTKLLNMALLLFASIVEILAIMLLTNQMIKPLSDLAERARMVGHGKMDMPPLTVLNEDEVGQVTTAFNKMVVRLNNYIQVQQQQLREENRLKEEQLQLEAHLKDSQLGALQAQINPHFLYNTLNAGSQLAMIEDAERTSVFLEHVADYFRYNLHRAGNDVYLREELSQVENYIFIMNTRYAGDINYEKRIPKDLPEVKLPGMILQPIVENAIEHGLRNIEEGEKNLILSVRKKDRIVYVIVSNNGENFDEKKAKELLDNKDRSLHTSRNQKHGIGMSNVISRLRIFYDRDDVMEIGSMPDGTGCEIKIKIPIEDNY